MIKVKDFILDDIPSKEESDLKKRNKVEYSFSLEYENDSDFIVKKCTKNTERLLVCLVSQGQIYIKDNKTNEVTRVEELDQVKKFRQGYNCCLKFEKLQWEPFCTTWGEEYNHWRMLLDNVTAVKELMNMKINPFKQERVLSQYRNGKDAFMRNFEYAKALQLLKPDVNIGECKTLLDNMRQANITYNNVKDNLTTLLDMGWESFKGVFERNNAHMMMSEYRCDFSRLVEWLTYTIKNRNRLNLFYSYYGRNFTTEDYLDYLNMQYQMYGKVKEKYPDFWLSEKQMMNEKYNEWKKLKNNTQFSLHQNRLFDNVRYENEYFKVVVPLTNTEILDEADQQKHCVASYIDRIVKGETNIVFIREKSNLDTSLLTVEIRDNKICQVRGFQNRAYNKIEYDFMKEWADKTHLILEVPDVEV